MKKIWILLVMVLACSMASAYGDDWMECWSDIGGGKNTVYYFEMSPYTQFNCDATGIILNLSRIAVYTSDNSLVNVTVNYAVNASTSFNVTGVGTATFRIGNMSVNNLTSVYEGSKDPYNIRAGFTGLSIFTESILNGTYIVLDRPVTGSGGTPGGGGGGGRQPATTTTTLVDENGLPLGDAGEESIMEWLTRVLHWDDEYRIPILEWNVPGSLFVLSVLAVLASTVWFVTTENRNQEKIRRIWRRQ